MWGGQNDSARRQYNQFLDFLKGIGCIGVVFIHIKFPGAFGELIWRLAQFAVPVFLMISGYYAYEENVADACGTIRRRCLKLTKFTLYAVLLYSVYEFVILIFGNEFEAWKDNLTIVMLGKIIVFNDFDIIHGGHLWFLPALVYVYIIWYFVEKHHLRAKIYRGLPLLFLLYISVMVYTETMELSWHYSGNFLIGALPYFVMGNYISRHKNKIEQIPDGFLVLTTIVSSMFSAIFTICSLPIKVAGIGPLIYSVAMFLLAIKHPDVSVNTGLAILGNQYSRYVYVIHVAVAAVLRKILTYGGIDTNKVFYLWLQPLMVVIVSILISAVYAKIKARF